MISWYLYWISKLKYGEHPKAIDNIKIGLWPTLTTAWMIWPITIYLLIMYVPLVYRSIVGGVITLNWNLYLSVRNEMNIKKQKEISNKEIQEM